MRNGMAIAVAVVVVLASFGAFDEAQAAFLAGDFITFSQTSWGDGSNLGGIAVLAHYDSVYAPFGFLEVGIAGAGGHSIVFTSSNALLNFLPASGPAAPLNADLVDPTTSASGIFGGEVTGLHLNIDFSDAGHTLGALGIPFGDLVVHDVSEIPEVNGLTVRQVLAQAEALLGGGTVGYTPLEASLFLLELNNSFPNGEVSEFAQGHLLLPSQVPEPGTLVLMGIGVVGLAVGRFTRRFQIRGRR